jgi:adenine/guanine phosphoribosyltransferase-like PRPP-binding protein
LGESFWRKHLKHWALATVKHIKFVESRSAKVAGLVFFIELPALDGRKLIEGYVVNSVVIY